MTKINSSKIQIKLLEDVRSPKDFEDFRNNLLNQNKNKLESFLEIHIEDSSSNIYNFQTN